MLHSHLQFAHTLWQTIVQPGNTIIDATVGNGHDALFLAQLLQGRGSLIGYDRQKQAITNTQKRLATLLKGIEKNICIQLHASCHTNIKDQASLVVYNLGYLPGGNKTITTKAPTTIQSIQKAQELLLPQGVISITLYPGHKEGLEEKELLLDYASSLDKKLWDVSLHSWLNRKQAPMVLFFQKKKIPLAS